MGFPPVVESWCRSIVGSLHSPDILKMQKGSKYNTLPKIDGKAFLGLYDVLIISPGRERKIWES